MAEEKEEVKENEEEKPLDIANIKNQMQTKLKKRNR